MRAAFLLAAALARAVPLPVPPFAPLEKGSLQTNGKDGKPLWSAEWTTEKAAVDGRPAMRFTETGRGRHGRFDEDVTWTIEGLYWLGETVTFDHVERIVKDASGKVVEKVRKSYDAAKGLAVVEKTDEKGRVKRKEFEAPSDTVATEGIGTLLRSLPFGSAAELHLLTGEPRLYRIELRPDGREKLTVPAGTYDCWKVRLVPDLGALNLFRAMVPRTTFWFQADAPHRWVRYEGLESGLGSPRVVMSLTRFESF